MSLSRPITRTESDALMREFRKMKDRLRRLENQHSPTVPVYDPDFPTDAVDAQIAIASTPPDNLEEESDALPYFFWDENWHPFAGVRGRQKTPYVWAISETFTVTTIDTDYTPTWGVNAFVPDPYDTAIYTIASTSTVSAYGIHILEPGLYWVRGTLGDWKGDWGAVIFQLVGPDGVQLAGFSETNSSMNQWLVKPASAYNMTVRPVHDKIVAVDDIPEGGVGISFQVFNNSGDAADRANQKVTLAAIRLSAYPGADQALLV